MRAYRVKRLPAAVAALVAALLAGPAAQSNSAYIDPFVARPRVIVLTDIANEPDDHAAITENSHGKGLATYIGFMPSEALMTKVLEDAVRKADLWGADQALQFPLITKSGTNQQGKTVHYYFNYSAQAATFRYPHAAGKDLLSGAPVAKGSEQRLPAWGVMIVVQD